MIIAPKGWADFQHYKDRAPPWIKLHKTLLDNYEYQSLPVASRALAPMLWLLASDYQDGAIDALPVKLAFRFRMTEQELLDAVKPLIHNGFFVVLQDDSNALAGCNQSACLETEREAEKETETKAEPRKRVTSPSKPDDVSAEVWDEWKQLRQKKRATCTASVVEGARLEAQKAGLSLEEFFKVWVRRGSQGLEAAWLKPNERGVPVQSFAEQDRQAGFERWEEMTGRIHPDRKQAPRVLDLLPVDQLTIGATK